MKFFSDCAAHWRWMGAEAQARCTKRPGHTLKRMLLHPFMFAFIFFLLCMYWNSVLSVVADQGVNGGLAPLEDKGHALGFIDYFELSDRLLYGLLAALAFRFLPLWPCVKPQLTVTMLRRWFILMGVMFFMRGASVAMTYVPYPLDDCVPTATGNVFVEGFNYIFGVTHTCGDCMFSGHTSTITLTILFWTHYSRGEELALFCGRHPGVITSNVDAVGDPVGWKLLDLLLWAFAIMCYYFILATRFHYSNDVFMGFVISYFMFRYYHAYVQTLGLKNGTQFARFMRWFEGVDLSMQQQMHGVDGVQSAASVEYVTMMNKAMEIGNLATSDNRTWGKQPPATLLPVSYMNGLNYYRVPPLVGGGAGTAADQRMAQDGNGLQKDGRGGVGDKSHLPRSNIEMANSNFVGSHSGYERDTALQQAQPSGSLQHPAQYDPNYAHHSPPILLTGEMARQEQREADKDLGMVENKV